MGTRAWTRRPERMRTPAGAKVGVMMATALLAVGLSSTPAIAAGSIGSSDLNDLFTGSADSGTLDREVAPQADLPGWKHIFADDFTKDAVVGTWANTCSPDDIVYTGAEGQKWRTYPSCYTDTFGGNPYRSDEVLSVENGVLNFDLHTVDGRPAGANPSPLIDGSRQSQTYGRYSMRMRVDSSMMTGYYIAGLLWPESENWPADGEINFPEGELSGTVRGYHHFAIPDATPNSQAVASESSAVFTDWHTYTVEWTPTVVRMIVDNDVVLESTYGVPSTPMRWQLQVETTKNLTVNDGNLEIDWVSAWAYDGA